MKKKIINHVNLILQIALVFLLFHLNNISMKYYGTPKTKLIINVMIIIHSLMIVRLFIKKHPFTNSIYTIILTVLLIAPLCFELEIKKPTDDMVIDYFMESKYADEKIIQVQHTLEDDYRYVVITMKDKYFQMHIYQNDQLIKNYTYTDLKIDSIEDENFKIVPIVENRKLYQKVPVYSNQELYYLYYLVNNEYDIQVTAIHIGDDLVNNLTQINENIYHSIILDTLELEESSEYILASLGASYIIADEYLKGKMLEINLIDENYEMNRKFIYLKENSFNETFIVEEDTKLYVQDGKIGAILSTKEGKKVLYYFDIEELSLPPKIEYLD